MTIYNYDQDGVFTGQSIAEQSPLEPGVYLLPAFATFEKPPAFTEGQAVIWTAGTWTVQNIPAPVEPSILTVVETWALIREKRGRLLADCDWTQLADVTLSIESATAWKIYRQALRDITTAASPEAVSWPVKPSETNPQ